MELHDQPHEGDAENRGPGDILAWVHDAFRPRDVASDFQPRENECRPGNEDCDGDRQWVDVEDHRRSACHDRHRAREHCYPGEYLNPTGGFLQVHGSQLYYAGARV